MASAVLKVFAKLNQIQWIVSACQIYKPAEEVKISFNLREKDEEDGTHMHRVYEGDLETNFRLNTSTLKRLAHTAALC